MIASEAGNLSPMTVDDRAEAFSSAGPELKTSIPGPTSRTWLLRHAHRAVPMGPKAPPGQPAFPKIVYARAHGSHVWDVDGNRFVDLAAGFGAQLLGHRHPWIERAVQLQNDRLWQALGDLFPADAKIALPFGLSALAGD